MIALPPEQIVQLTPGELGLIVLEDLIATSAWSEWNYVNEANQGQYRGEGANAIAGALGWLRGQGLIGRDPRNSSGSAIVVTPAGRRAARKEVATHAR